MNRDEMRKLLIEHEGKKNYPYLCKSGKITIGIGRNLTDKGISDREIEFLFKNDLEECLVDLNKIFPDYFLYPEYIQQVLCDMRFNLGPEGFRSFKKLIAAVINKDWKAMKREMKNSKWYEQVPNRAKDLMEMIP